MSRFTMLKRKTQERQPLGLTLHVGEKKAADRPGKGIDYFRADGHFADRFNQKFEGKPQSLKIFFPKVSPADLCHILTECRNSAGVIMAKAHSNWWEEDSEWYEIFKPEVQDWFPVSEQEYVDHLNTYGLTEEFTLKLSFMLLEFMKDGISAKCVISTKGKESSIPNIVQTMQCAWNTHRIQFPFELSVIRPTGKGVGKDGKSFTKNYSVLQLHMITSQEAMTEQVHAIESFARIQLMSFQEIVDENQKQISGHHGGPALNAASEKDLLITQGDECWLRIEALTQDASILSTKTLWDSNKHKWGVSDLNKALNKLLTREQTLLEVPQEDDALRNEPEPIVEMQEQPEHEPEHTEPKVEQGPFEVVYLFVKEHGTAPQQRLVDEALQKTPVDEQTLQNVCEAIRRKLAQ